MTLATLNFRLETAIVYRNQSDYEAAVEAYQLVDRDGETMLAAGDAHLMLGHRTEAFSVLPRSHRQISLSQQQFCSRGSGSNRFPHTT